MQRFVGLIVGIVFLAAGAFMFVRHNNMVKNCTKEVMATVVDMKEELSSDSEDMSYIYYPIVEYKVDNKTISSVMESGSSSPAYSIGEKITILYNPKKPKEFIVKGEKSTSIFSIVFMGLGVLITGYGLVMVFKKD